MIRETPPRVTIAAVTFDVGGTLIEPWPSVGHVYAEVAASFRLAGLNPDALNRGFAAAWKRGSGHDYSRAAWQSLVNETFASAGAAQPSDECFNALYARFVEADAWRVFDDARPALESLRSLGLRLAIVSNWDERLRPLLDALDLTRWFQVIVISHEVGHAKPSPEIFLHAAARLHLPPASILHIGDSTREDLGGASSAGMLSVLLDRDRSKAAGQAIPTLALLPSLLASLSHQSS